VLSPPCTGTPVARSGGVKYVVFSLLVTACAMDRDIATKVTIAEGVYGQLTSDGLPVARQAVTVYTASGDYATATSDGDGVYQIALPNGDYTICTSACTTITTPSSARVRYDWTDGPGGGTWDKI
jgi:hypothetical protein